VTLTTETKALRQRLQALAVDVESELVDRYPLRLQPGGPLSPYRRLRIFVGKQLRALGLRKTPEPEPWLAGLKHRELQDDPRTLLIWALNSDPATIREACEGLHAWLSERPDFAPVLVTDIADFAYYSRLGWLVEFVPRLSPPAERFFERKQRYIAWRYRDAQALPLSAGLHSRTHVQEVLLD
jgi:hypothetical protein